MLLKCGIVKFLVTSREGECGGEPFFWTVFRSSYGGIMKLLSLRKKLCGLRYPVVDGSPKVTEIQKIFTRPLWLEEEEIGSWL